MSDGSTVLDVVLDERLDHGARVHVRHRSAEVAARVTWLGGRFHQLRCAAPLMAARGDRIALHPAGVTGAAVEGVVLDPAARRHGPTNDTLVRLARLERGEDEPAPDPAPPAPTLRRVRTMPSLDAAARALEARLRAAGADPLALADLSDAERDALDALHARGRVARIGTDLEIHVDVLDEIVDRVAAIVEAGGAITVATLRDELGTSERSAEALLDALAR